MQDASSSSWDIYKQGSAVVLDVLRAVVNRLAEMPGNRVLVILSRGLVTGGMDREKSAIVNAAVRAHIVINGLNTEGLATGNAFNYAQRQNTLSAMVASVSSATGGRFIKNDNDLPGALDTLAAPPAVSYLLGFAPSNPPDDTYHTLQLQARNGRGYQLDSRHGYWSEKSKAAEEPAQRRIDDAVLSARDIAEIPTTLRVSIPAPQTAGPILVRVSVDARKLRFLKKHGRSLQELTFVAVLENGDGSYLAGKQAVMDLALTASRLASLESTGIQAVMTFPSAPGKYNLRAVVREAGENRTPASTARFQIR